MKKQGIVGGILAVCLLLGLAYPVLAGGLTVSGAKIETVVSPGSEYVYNMKVDNTSDEPMDIAVEIKGYGMSADRDFIALEPEEDKSPYSAREWLTADPSNFHLEPGASQEVKTTARIPSGTGEGGRYAIVLIHTISKGGMVSTITAVAARVLFTISGFSVNTASEITQISLAKAASGAPAGLTVTVANKGNYHFKPEIQAKLINGDKVVATASVAPGWPIIPGYSRQFKIDFPGQESLPAAKYKVDIEVKDGAGNLLIGGNYQTQSAKNQEVLSPIKPPAAPSAPETPSPTSQPQSETPTAPASPSATNWPVIGGIIAVVIIGLFVFFLVRRRA